ncbi:hypothetical protein AO378_1239 [Moraxella catarrhalis]|nr:hypothetical protein AO378_1239 [Moraxella catarrhalis]
MDQLDEFGLGVGFLVFLAHFVFLIIDNDKQGLTLLIIGTWRG